MKNLKKIALIALTLMAVMSLLCVSVAATDGSASPAAEMLNGLFSGTNLALLGVALAVALPCIGSAKGLSIVGEAATGMLSEKPDMFGKAFLLLVLPMTQGMYGLVAAFMTLMNLGLFENPDYLMNLSFTQGGYVLMASLPIALAGLISAVRQGRVAATGINLIGKRPNSLGHAITTAALVETYAMFALLITIVLILRCPFRV